MEKKKFEIQPKKKFEINHEFQTYTDGTLISEVKPIEQGMYYPESSSHLETIIEYPLLDATKNLLEKGIKSYASSANQKDVNGSAYIILYYSSLNDTNKQTADKFDVYEYQKEKFVKIAVPVDENTTVGELKNKFNEIANTFETQEK